MAIKIIDLLNKNANGEYPVFKWDNMVWKHDGGFYRNGTIILDEYANITTCLNDTVEITEDNDKLEKIEITGEQIKTFYDGGSHFVRTNRKDRHLYIPTLNKIIDHINKIEEKLDER